MICTAHLLSIILMSKTFVTGAPILRSGNGWRWMLTRLCSLSWIDHYLAPFHAKCVCSWNVMGHAYFEKAGKIECQQAQVVITSLPFVAKILGCYYFPLFSILFIFMSTFKVVFFFWELGVNTLMRSGKHKSRLMVNPRYSILNQIQNLLTEGET